MSASTIAARTVGQLRPPRRHVPTASGAALLIALVGGYGFGWQWTGFAGKDELWDLLHLLLLPVILTLVPLWHRTHRSVPGPWRAVLVLTTVAFATVVFGGYRMHWTWTGFAGNALWDWLHLLVLPIAVTALPLWLQTHDHRRPQWRLTGTCVLVAFTVTVIGGYGLGWSWTGFVGNTFWDWLQLLLVPFALPIGIALLTRPAAGNQDPEPPSDGSAPAGRSTGS